MVPLFISLMGIPEAAVEDLAEALVEARAFALKWRLALQGILAISWPADGLYVWRCWILVRLGSCGAPIRPPARSMTLSSPAPR